MRTIEHRMTELHQVFEQSFSARLLADFTDDVSAAYCNTARVVRALGGADINEKEVVISLGDNGPWGVERISLGKPETLNACRIHSTAARTL